MNYQYIHNRFFLLILSFLISVLIMESNLYAQYQSNEYEINLRSRNFTPPAEGLSSLESLAGKNNLLIQFYDKLDRAKVDQLKNRGIIVNGVISSRTLSITVNNTAELSQMENVRWIGTLSAEDKISPRLNNMSGEIYTVIQLHMSLNKADHLNEISNYVSEVIENPYLPRHLILAKLDLRNIAGVISNNAVAYVYEAHQNLLSGNKVYYCPGAKTQFGYIPEYVTQGEGWDGPGKGTANLKYHFVNGTPDVSGEAAEVVAALETWSQYASINWSSTNNANQNNSIDILWASGDHGDVSPFDGTSGVLAHCFYPNDINSEPIAGDMHFDEDETWRIGSDIDVYSVALHEAGHGLGLQHSDDVNAIMYAFYGGPVADLRQDDINGIRELYGTVSLPRTSPPVFDPVSGAYPSPLEVRLNFGAGSNSSNTRIYYTLDGSEPTPYSFEFVPGGNAYIFQRYSNTIRARAFKQGALPSEVVSATYILQPANPTVAQPTISPNGGIFTEPVSVTLDCETDFAVIRYTTDGTEPTQASFAYSGPIQIISSTVLKAKAFRNDYSPSPTAATTFIINVQPDAPQFYPPPGVFAQAVDITLYSETPGADIYYTVNGENPNTNSTLYTGPFTINNSTLVKAVAVSGSNLSNTVEGNYFVNTNLPGPGILPISGQYTENVEVFMTTSIAGAEIRYTTNGAEPTNYSNLYNGSFTLGVGQHTVKAKLFLNNYQPSTTVTREYTVYSGNTAQVETPTVVPRSTQTFTTSIPISMSCATEGATIRYTVGIGQLPPDPSPTGGGSITYNGPFVLGQPGQQFFLKVQAYKDGMTPSSIVQTGQLSVVTPVGVMANPVIETQPGVYNNNITVEISHPDQFAQVVYTKDGSEPDTFLPILPPTSTYNNGILLTQSATIKTKAYRTFFTDSETVEAAFVLKCGKPEITPDSGNFFQSAEIVITSVTANAQIRYTLDGSEPDENSDLYSGSLNLGLGSYSLAAKAFKNGFNVSETSYAEIVVLENESAPVITMQPQGITINEGETAVMKVEAVGTPAPEFQWYRNGVMLPGENLDSLRIENAQTGDSGLYSVKVSNSAGNVISNEVQLNVNSLTSVNENKLAGTPTEYALYGNYPNPFNPSTTIRYSLPNESYVRISIFNMLGEKVEELTDQIKSAGYYEVRWDASSLASGIYIVNVSAQSLSDDYQFVRNHKLVLTK